MLYDWAVAKVLVHCLFVGFWRWCGVFTVLIKDARRLQCCNTCPDVFFGKCPAKVAAQSSSRDCSLVGASSEGPLFGGVFPFFGLTEITATTRTGTAATTATTTTSSSSHYSLLLLILLLVVLLFLPGCQVAGTGVKSSGLVVNLPQKLGD